MIDTEIYKSKVLHYCSNNQQRNRLVESERILLNSARKIANLQIDLIDRGISSHIITMTPIMLAMMILALNILKYPSAARNGSDLEVSPNLSWTPPTSIPKFIILLAPHPAFTVRRSTVFFGRTAIRICPGYVIYCMRLSGSEL
jgi:hypothetical protein